MTATFRLAYLKDAPRYIETVAAWHHEEWLKTREATQPIDHSETFQKRFEMLQTHGGADHIPATLIAITDDRVIGSASIIYYQFSSHYATSPWLTNVYVCEGFRNKGIGTTLVSSACKHAKSAGVKTLMLYTHDKEQFYLDRGWKQLRNGQILKRSVVVMEKSL